MEAGLLRWLVLAGVVAVVIGDKLIEDPVDEVDGPLPFVGNIPGEEELGKLKLEELPTEFSMYDLNKDNVITVDELAKVTGTKEEDAMHPFETADVNGDLKLTEKEFDDAPWIFQLPPSADPFMEPNDDGIWEFRSKLQLAAGKGIKEQETMEKKV
ncbi:uncharacterized protein LOC118415788 [Branchiostoma floridae]|uniref:Uncharacterized protein LOC118415788 n=1 Tax=Branchiostoma floridae TaxID=7739 RepID=A0A9J7L6K3_BRAFL|nr:uncharacterized protein LOC118415788 [Branchiostoma floridae]XP_035676501.1 uncharacterized protein LOC118415788 [Branchiostoma floridae]